MNDKINDIFHTIEGLSLFINKRMNSYVYENKVSIKKRWEMIKKLREDYSDLKYYFRGLFLFISIPFINLIISIFFVHGVVNVLEDIGIFTFSLILSYFSVFVMSYLLKDDIDKYIDKNVLKNIKLNKSDVMELGLYLTDRDKDILVNKINKNHEVSLKDIKSLLNEKEVVYRKEKAEIVKMNKEKEINELTKSINLLK